MAHEALKLEIIEAIAHAESEQLLQQVRTLLKPQSSASSPPIVQKQRALAGWGKGLIGELPEDFDEPLDDLKDYM